MTIQELLREGTEYLKELESGKLEAQMLLAFVLQTERTRLLIYPDTPVDEAQQTAYRGLLQQRKDRVPVQYLTGECEFMSLPFFVDSNVLIPRWDTEILVETVLERKPEGSIRIADLCCGSGCIGVSLAHCLPEAEVFFADVSEGALAIAQRNAVRNGVADRTTFQQMDVLEDPLEGMFDVIVANPPYIPAADIETLEPEVREHEPRLALEAPEEGLLFYRVLPQKCAQHLKEGGLIAFEVGIGQAAQVAGWLQPFFRKVEIGKDLQGIDRVVSALR